MRISQLSERAGLPVGTVKFYLRTGLLPAGRTINATQAAYNESHLERLRLIRALIEVGRLSVAEIQNVLAAVDTPDQSIPEGLAAVHQMTSIKGPEVEASELAVARELVGSLGWAIDDNSPHLDGLARAISALTSVGQPPTPGRLRVYAEAASHVARHDVDWVQESPEDVRVERALVSAVLWEALLSSLRRLAAENQAARNAGGVPAPRVTVPSA